MNVVLMGNSKKCNWRLGVLRPRPAKQEVMQCVTLIQQWAIKRKWKQRAKKHVAKEAIDAL